MNKQTGIEQPAGSTWTDEQWQAITARGSDILVAAAAGSGKTAVLVERIIKRITDPTHPIDVDRLLIVTFTNASAAEMKKRIGTAIEEELQKSPQSAHLKRQLVLLNRASISTLHSFCQSVLRRYYYELDVDPAFRLVEETEAALLREEVLADLFEELYSVQDNDSFFQLVDCFSTDRSDLDVQTLVSTLYDFSRSHPFPEKWLQQMADRYRSEGMDVSFWTDDLLADINLQFAGLINHLEQGLLVTKQAGGPAPYAVNLDQDMESLKRVQRATQTSWEAIYEAFQEKAFGNLKPCKGEEYADDLKEKVKAIREQVKKQFNQIKEAMFRQTLVEHLQDLEQMAPVMHTLVAIVLQFGNQYRQTKREKSLADFSDLEHDCLAILGVEKEGDQRLLATEAALDYRRQFEEVLVDEYQDTNLVQEAILQLITRDEPGNLFMVGDVKQSIYRFRLAEPNLFLQKYKRFSPSGAPKVSGDEGEASTNTDQGNDADLLQIEGLRIDLARNFRSRAEVLDGTNYLFKQVMNERVGDIAYDDNAKLKVGAEYPPDDHMSVELMLIDRGSVSNGQNHNALSAAETDASEGVSASVQSALEGEELETAQLEARCIAQQMKRLIGSTEEEGRHIYDAKRKQSRPIQYRDMVILLRSVTQWAPVILAELKQQGIPAYAELSTGYFQETEVAVMLSLLQVIDNPYQDIPLASVLRSPVIGLNEEELARIRIHQVRGSFYEALKAYVQTDGQSADKDEQLQHKLRRFYEQLTSWRTRARRGSLAELIWNIYRETGYFDFVGGIAGGQQRQANLRALYDRAKQYESTSFRGLFRFLRFIERLRDRGGDLGTARALGEQEDVVRVMTIHKSKGLEFPVVFMGGIAKKFNRMDLNQTFMMHKALGFGSKFVDTEERISYPTIPQLAIKRKIEMELLAEEMRVLYVALTRAKEKLYVIGTVRDTQKQIEKWQQHINHPEWSLNDFDRAQAKCYLDWIGPALVRHRDTDILREIDHQTECAQIDKRFFEHPSQWQVTVVDPNSLTAEDWQREERDQEAWVKLAQSEPVPINSDKRHEIEDLLSWQYPFQAAQRKMAKQSVTELKRQKEWLGDHDGGQGVENLAGQQLFQAPNADRPKFMQSGKLKAAERGTAMHSVMQHLPFESDFSVQDIREHVHHMIEDELLTERQAEAIDLHSIFSFLQSDLGQRISQAGMIYREVPFSLAVPAREVFVNESGLQDDTTLVQGVIDCMIEDSDGLVMIDYKTDAIQDRFKDGFEEARPILLERYQLQLDVYARAVESIWKKPVKEKYLYFFDGSYVLQVE